MLSHISLNSLLFIDIETTSNKSDFKELSSELQILWSEKISKTEPENRDLSGTYSERAALFAEFGRIVCISVGYFPSGERQKFRVKSFAGADEKAVLSGFFGAVSGFEKSMYTLKFCGHNIQEFDIPYICRRALIHALPLPNVLQISGKKPWEMPVVDTMQLWRFGAYRDYISLRLLTGILDISTPKDDIDGSQVGEVFWHEKDIQRIATYCQKDVIAVAQLMLRFKIKPLLEDQNIEIVE